VKQQGTYLTVFYHWHENTTCTCPIIMVSSYECRPGEQSEIYNVLEILKMFVP